MHRRPAMYNIAYRSRLTLRLRHHATAAAATTPPPPPPRPGFVHFSKWKPNDLAVVYDQGRVQASSNRLFSHKRPLRPPTAPLTRTSDLPPWSAPARPKTSPTHGGGRPTMSMMNANNQRRLSSYETHVLKRHSHR